jgi:hypothetical protein
VCLRSRGTQYRTHASSTMAPFSMLRRSPRNRKGNEQQKEEHDVKTEGGTPAQEDDQRDSNRTMVGSKETADGEIKGRRGFNKELLYNIRNRLTGKPPSSTPQRGTASEVRKVTQPLRLPSCMTICRCSRIRGNCIMRWHSLQMAGLCSSGWGRCEPSQAQAVEVGVRLQVPLPLSRCVVTPQKEPA